MTGGVGSWLYMAPECVRSLVQSTVWWLVVHLYSPVCGQNRNKSQFDCQSIQIGETNQEKVISCSDSKIMGC